MVSARFKPDTELVVQQNIDAGRIFEEVVEEGPLVEGASFEISTNGKRQEDWQPKTRLIKKLEDELLVVK